MRFIKGEAENLTNGWFTVKQPATSDLNDGMTWEEARQRESLFFSTILPWSSETDWHHRFGTHNLTKALSIILSDLIKRRWVYSEKPDFVMITHCHFVPGCQKSSKN